MDNKELKVYAIVVTFNGEKWIRKCLNSLKQSENKVHTIVIDNCSIDDTLNIIKLDFPEVELINSSINLGFGNGNNLGLRKAFDAKADYIFLLNQDAWIEKETINCLVEAHQQHPEFGILSPFHLNYEGNEMEHYFSTIIPQQACPSLINDIYFKQLKQVYEIEFIHAAAWLISKKCLETVGGFDPIFPHYSEDNDYINRAKYYQFKIGIVPASIVYHYGSNAVLNSSNYNLKFHLNFILLHLKNINHKFRGLLLVHIKSSLDKITSAILYRRFKEFGFQTVLFWKSIFCLRKILKSRKVTKNKKAYF